MRIFAEYLVRGDKNMSKKICSIIGKLLAVIVIAVIVTAAAGCYFYDKSLVTYEYYSEEGYEIGGVITSSEKITEAEIDWRIGDIQIKCGDKIDGFESGEKLESDKRMRWKVNDGKLTVRFWRPSYVARIEHSDKDLTVTLPQGIDLKVSCVAGTVKIDDDIQAGNINLESTSGSVKCDSIFSTGRVSLKSTSGSVNAENITAKIIKLKSTSGSVKCGNVKAESVDARSTSGSVRLDNIAADEVKLDCTSGNIVCKKVEAKEILAQNTSGRITIDEVSGCTQVEIDATSGDVEIGLNECASVIIDAGSGDVTVTLRSGYTVYYHTSSGEFSTTAQFTDKDGRKVFGDGKNSLEIETSSGNIEIR